MRIISAFVGLLLLQTWLPLAEAFTFPSAINVGVARRHAALSCRSTLPLRHATRSVHARRSSVDLKMLFDFGNSAEEEFPHVETFFPAVDRIVAVGDVHGDIEALRGCMKIANLIDNNDNWIGGETHFVQIGDILDRGDGEKACLDLLAKLKREAKAAGGMVHVLLGNHEIMNADLDFRYVTPGAWDMWGEPPSGTMIVRMKERLKTLGYPEYMKGRINAFKPGGPVARNLAKMQVAIQIGDTLLVHGGLRKKHVDYGVEKINGLTKKWLLEGPGVAKPQIIDETDSPVWARLYSTPQPTDASKAELQDVLVSLGAQRMIVGHTPQLRGINSHMTEGGYEVWRCDTGMSRGMMSGPRECIEILRDGTVHVLTENGLVPAAMRSSEAQGEFMDVCDLDTNICTPPKEETENLMLTEQPAPDSLPSVYMPRDMLDLADDAQKMENQAGRLRTIDDPTKTERERIRLLVARVIAEAVANDDKSLTKKCVCEILAKVVGRQMVTENRLFVLEEVDRVVAGYINAKKVEANSNSR